MNYEKKPPAAYRSNPSVYSHGTVRSSINLHSSRTIYSVRNVAWHQKPIFRNQYVDIKKAALIVSFFSVFVAIFTILTSIFDVYCLAMATPGSTHYGYYVLSYEFVYVGNIHVRNALIIFALFSLILGVVILPTSIILIIALRKQNANRKNRRHQEYERNIIPWLWTFAVFTIVRLFAFLFFSLVNDLIFVYNVLMVLCWIIIVVTSIYGWILIYSLYIELADFTRLEDLAHLRMGIMASLNASTTQSLSGSRPITPHSTVSTMPVG